MNKFFQAMTIFSILAINPATTQASSLQEMCNEFASNQISQSVTLSITDSQNLTHVLKSAGELSAWCVGNFNSFISSVNILQMPELKVASSGWEVFGVPISNTFLTAATVGITAAGFYLSYKEYRREDSNQGLQAQIDNLRERIAILGANNE